MRDRSLVSDTRQSLGKPPHTALRPVQRRQQRCHRAECAPLTAILLGWRVITCLLLTTATYMCWSNCSSLPFSLLVSLARYTLLHWTEVHWNLKLWKKEFSLLLLNQQHPIPLQLSIQFKRFGFRDSVVCTFCKTEPWPFPQSRAVPQLQVSLKQKAHT